MPSEAYLDKYKTAWNKYSTSGVKYESNPHLVSEVLSRAGPTQIYYRPGFSSEVSNVTKYTTEITHLPSTVTSVQYKINEDPDPVRIVRQVEPVTQRQSVRVRYLEPPNPPTPNPIIIKERQLTPPPPAPPIYIRQQAPAPPTPPPLVIRERPPSAPKMPETTIIEKIIPPPTPPPRQVIVERIPAPEKPRDIIYEKWLPYKPLADRQVIVERGKIYEKQPAPKNVIIEYENPNINIDRRVYDEGVIRINDPDRYNSARPNGELRIVDKITDLPVPNYVSNSTVVYQPTWSQTTVRPITPKPSSSVSLTDLNKNRPKTSFGTRSIIKGPVAYNGPWNTTYKTSYTGRGFNKNY